MAPAVTLNDPGSETSFPSWAGASATELWIKNLSSSSKATLKIQAGAHSGEDLNVPANDQKSFRRKFGGLRFRAINNGGVPVRVWTV